MRLEHRSNLRTGQRGGTFDDVPEIKVYFDDERYVSIRHIEGTVTLELSSKWGLRIDPLGHGNVFLEPNK